MKSTTITIAGKQVGIAYCFATEIAFRKYTGEDFNTYISTISQQASQGNVDVDAEKSLYLILSAIMAYYNGRGEETPVKDTDLMYECSPQELITAYAEVMRLYREWYQIPAGEPEDRPAKDKGGRKRKNA